MLITFSCWNSTATLPRSSSEIHARISHRTVSVCSWRSLILSMYWNRWRQLSSESAVPQTHVPTQVIHRVAMTAFGRQRLVRAGAINWEPSRTSPIEVINLEELNWWPSTQPISETNILKQGYLWLNDYLKLPWTCQHRILWDYLI